jgi:predicted enzyme related to lactoylglutathione lyase
MPRLNAKLIAVNVPARNSSTAQAFYQALMGADFARSWTTKTQSMHTPINEDRQWLWISQRMAPDEGITAWFAVDNLDQTITALEGAGGRRVGGVVDAPIAQQVQQTYEQQRPNTQTSNTMGKFQLMQDPEGNHLWLGEVEEHAHEYFALGKYDRGLSQKTVEAHQRVKQVGARLAGGNVP